MGLSEAHRGRTLVRMLRFDFQTFRANPGAGLGGLYQQLTGRPSWPIKAALFAGVTVIVVPLVFLALAGLTVGLAVFVVSSLIARVIAWISGDSRSGDPSSGGDGGRRNVRILKDQRNDV